MASCRGNPYIFDLCVLCVSENQHQATKVTENGDTRDGASSTPIRPHADTASLVVAASSRCVLLCLPSWCRRIDCMALDRAKAGTFRVLQSGLDLDHSSTN